MVRTSDAHGDYVGGLAWFEKGRDDDSSCPLYLVSGGWDGSLRGLFVSSGSDLKPKTFRTGRLGL